MATINGDHVDNESKTDGLLYESSSVSDEERDDPTVGMDAKSPLLSREVRLQGYNDDQEPPTDRYNLVYMIFMLQGVGMLLPWNAFITVTEYLKQRLVNSYFEDNHLLYITFGFQIANITFLWVATKFQHHIDLRARILVSLGIELVVFLTTTVVSKSNSIEGNTFFAINFVVVIVCGAATAFMQGGLFGLAGSMPIKYTQALMAGQGYGGVIVALLNIVTLAAMDDGKDVDGAAFLFYLIAVVTVALCLLSCVYLLNQPLVKFYRTSSAPSPSINQDATPVRRSSVSDTFVQVRRLALSVGLVFAVTLSVFPNIASMVAATSGAERYRDSFFVPIFCFLGFNVSDLCGRSLAGVVHWPSRRRARHLIYPSMFRILLIPLFLFCHLEPLNATDHMPTWFHSDAFPYIFMLVLGASNGYFASLCMMYGPTVVDPVDADRAGSLMAFSLTIGLALGSLLSFMLRAMICHCNPFVKNSHNTTTFELHGY
eukprot:m.486141 g.486141  ORF g.486141 m.486141 type:complete len:486 (+) comp24195_c0_seq1:411-1868(+)